MARRIINHALTFILLTALWLMSSVAHADPFPPYYDIDASGNPTGAGVHYAPQPWPDYDDWIPYTSEGNTVNDPRNNDDSNGGARPQNFVNVSSGCTDESKPSVYWYFNTSTRTLFYRWRVEQIPVTYHVSGNNPSDYSNSDPWKSALWSVFFDVDGDGYREYAMHLDGSSGTAGADIDLLVGIYGNADDNSVDPTDPNVYETGHNPTGFPASSSDEKILGFDALSSNSSTMPNTDWIKGGDVYLWDYGTTRSIDIQTRNDTGKGDDNSCVEYYVDYQIPFSMLTDGAPAGALPLDENTPVSMFFATGNSLNDAFQKDAVLSNGASACTFTMGENVQLGFGDTVIFETGSSISQPIVNSITGGLCSSSVQLKSTVIDSTDCCAGSGVCETTSLTVTFYYYYDENGNGNTDDSGSAWTLIGDASNTDAGNWVYDWDPRTLPQGQYLIGVRAADRDPTNIANELNEVWSFLTDAEVASNTSPCCTAGLNSYANYQDPDTNLPGLTVGRYAFNNNCGVNLLWRPNQELSVTPGTQVVYQHELDISPGDTIGTLQFDVSSNQGWGWTLYLDNGDASFNVADEAAITWSTPATPNLTSGTYFLVYTVDASQNNIIDSTDITATYVVSGNSYVGTVVDVTTVVPSGFGYITGTKTAAIDTNCDGSLADESAANATFEATKSALNPGECVVFRIDFQNPAVDAGAVVTDVSIQDVVPTYTTYVSDASATATFNITPLGLVSGNITAPANGGTGTIEWSYTHDTTNFPDNPPTTYEGMQPGASGQVEFHVEVDQ